MYVMDIGQLLFSAAPQVHNLFFVLVCFPLVDRFYFWNSDAALTSVCFQVKMFRRSRFSIRPNVGTAGRTAATPQEAPPVNQEAGETPKDVSENNTPTAVTENKSVVTPSEKPTAQG